MNNRHILQLVLMALMIVSSSMLAISINHLYLIPVSVFAVLGAFVVTDTLKLISVEGLLANIILLGILFLSINEFYGADSSGKLIAVAKLLVFLQSVLVFQKKSPRLNWQIMVLSLLQVVITTIFSVDFEGGILFFIFFVLGSVALVLQNVFASEYLLTRRNELSEQPLKQFTSESFESLLSWWKYDTRPVPSVTSEPGTSRFSIRTISILPGVIAVAGLFTTVLFLTAPRHTQAWFSPITYQVESTNNSHKVQLEETGVVTSTSKRIFEAKFTVKGLNNDEPLRLGKAPYFRGLALSNLTYTDGKADWNAAYERVNKNTYQAIPAWRGAAMPRLANVEITMEKSANPLVYTTTPVSISENSSLNIQFCHELSAYTRCRENEKVDFAPYSYDLATPLDNRNSLASSWPYLANTIRYSFNPMSRDPAQERWLTRINRNNHPTLVRIADRIAKEVRESGGRRMELVKAIEAHFLNLSNYSYTTDYTEVQRNTDIDPTEDFVANFKKGHCEIFASAMTLMLRSQGIPARVVTGFYGGDFNDLDRSYVVRGTHAHAWVEVYMRRRDCRLAEFNPWEYAEGGAWLTADPTPLTPIRSDSIDTDDALELARNVWQDYVLGMEADEETEESDSFLATMMKFFRGLDINEVADQLSDSRKQGWLAIAQPLMLVFAILGCLLYLLRILIRSAGYEEEQPTTAVGKLKRFFADAIGLISSDLREWVIGQDPETAFYRKLTDVLERHDHSRKPDQTHREFAHDLRLRFAGHDNASLISQTVNDCTEAFNRVRFGKKQLGEDERKTINTQLDELERILRA